MALLCAGDDASRQANFQAAVSDGIRSSNWNPQAEEEIILQVVAELSAYQVAYSNSPMLSIDTFINLLAKNQRIFSFPAAGNTLLGASAFGSAYQLAVLANPLLAVEIAGAGAVAYLILKFGAAVGKRISDLIG